MGAYRVSFHHQSSLQAILHQFELKYIAMEMVKGDQQRACETLSCDCSKVTSQVLSFLSQNLSLVIEFVVWFWEHQKGEVGNFSRRLLFNHL